MKFKATKIALASLSLMIALYTPPASAGDVEDLLDVRSQIEYADSQIGIIYDNLAALNASPYVPEAAKVIARVALSFQISNFSASLSALRTKEAAIVVRITDANLASDAYHAYEELSNRYEYFGLEYNAEGYFGGMDAAYSGRDYRVEMPLAVDPAAESVVIQYRYEARASGTPAITYDFNKGPLPAGSLQNNTIVLTVTINEALLNAAGGKDQFKRMVRQDMDRLVLGAIIILRRDNALNAVVNAIDGLISLITATAKARLEQNPNANTADLDIVLTALGRERNRYANSGVSITEIIKSRPTVIRNHRVYRALQAHFDALVQIWCGQGVSPLTAWQQIWDEIEGFTEDRAR